MKFHSKILCLQYYLQVGILFHLREDYLPDHQKLKPKFECHFQIAYIAMY